MSNFWETLSDSAKNVANEVVNVTTDAYNIGKEKWNISKMKQQLRELYRQLGKLQYGIEREGVTDTARREQLLDEIGALKEQLKTAEAK